MRQSKRGGAKGLEEHPSLSASNRSDDLRTAGRLSRLHHPDEGLGAGNQYSAGFVEVAGNSICLLKDTLVAVIPFRISACSAQCGRPST
jgi:hypothetical protein